MTRFNWNGFIILTIVCYIGALGNEQANTIYAKLLLGTGFTIVGALPFALITSDWKRIKKL